MTIQTKRFTTALLACLLFGCATSGTKIDEATVNSLKKGESTVQDALMKLGQPNTRIVAGDGTTTLMYTYAESSVKAASFIPVVGLVAGGTDVSVTSTTLKFDAQGKLIDVTRMDSQHNSSVGIPPGRATTPPATQ
jgi:YD repeat-containing protein